MSLDVIFDSETVIIENNDEEKAVQSDEMCIDNSDTLKYEGYIPEETYFVDRKVTELARSSWHEGFYLRGCVWSPDGTCCLTVVENDGMHILELQKDLFLKAEELNGIRNVSVLDSAVHIKEGGSVYDYSWYPGMNSGYPDTCCWAATRQHEPIHMWDAFDGKLRCSYRGINDLDELDTAISIAFSYDGSNIFAGYKKSFRIFDTASPGNESTRIKIKFPTSCIASNYQHPDIVALGSWNKSLATCDTRTNSINILEQNSGHNGGITFLKFSFDGEFLVSGSRKENKMIAWDMRNLNQPLKIFERNVKTNQRIYFDLSKEGNWLLSGDTNGYVHVWNLKNDETKRISFPVHRDCCNGVSLHPFYPIIATSSGQFHGSGDAEVPGPDDTTGDNTTFNPENSLVFWKLGT